ncbi:hypothetical protein ASD24_24860 [Paenibacillus sp. Root52]|uniref:DUF5704 domain-containing protein n=1 Tax=Paenibacillus sp. Root52 TaxID=1736552 RepID=UPI0006F317B5|nr:DUF5704 domain-containing protein [Paenibacillus sp. Root52]KQY91030.1 hypothetical protein ASD24_24860 [Paenibacillus sp. Root52]
MQKNRRRLILVGLSVLLLTSGILGVFFPIAGKLEAAAPIKKDLSYNDGAKKHPQKGSLIFSKKPTDTVTISEDVGANNKIQKIEFYKGNQVVKTIDVNAQTFNQTVSFNGEKHEVLSEKNGSSGSYFAWSRGETRNWFADLEGETWQGISSLTDKEIGTEPINGKEHREFPGRKIKMTIKYSRNKPFFSTIDGVNLQFEKDFIDDRSNIIRQQNPSTPSEKRVIVDYDQDVSTGSLKITGKAHPTTVVTEILAGLEKNATDGPTRSLDFATITFTQEHYADGEKYYVRANSSADMVKYDPKKPNAQAMIYYYAAYNYTFSSFTYQYPDHYLIYTDDGPPPKDPQNSCTITDGRVIEGEKMTPNASAVIKADQRDREMFDVLLGIPTSESLYGNVLANEYLHQYKFQEKVGVCTYDITVTRDYTLNWDPGKTVPTADGKGTTTVPDPQTANETKNYPIHVERTLSYWVVDKLGVYEIDSAELKNYAFNGEIITIHPAGYVPPIVTLTREGKYVPDPGPGNYTAPSKTLNGGKSRPSIPSSESAELQALTESKIKEVKVNNDTLVFNSQTLMNGSVVDKKTQDPTRLPDPKIIGRDVLYSPGNMIPSSKINKQSEPSSGKIKYKELSANYNAPPGDTYPIGGINPVTVHTPVVNYSSASDDQPHNQKTTPNYSRMAFILDRPFTVTIPTSGQHLNYPGYGNRDYAKYFRSKEVYFPFDVYSADKSTFYPKNTWINIPVPQLTTEFFLPVWVDEGDYTVFYRNIAENAPDVRPTQQDANFDLINHVASDTVDVEVIGRLYDFHITDIADYNWEMVFRTQSGSLTPTGNSYWTGLLGIDGAARGNRQPFTLPILPGKNPLEGTKNVTVKTGYHVKFDLRTKGNMFSKQDGIRITPSFMYVSRDGKTKTAVDLYYDDDHRKFIKVGSKEDTEERYVILNDRLRNVPEEELTDTARYKYDNYYTFAEMNGVSRDLFIADYIRRFTKEKTPVGGFSLMLLPEQIRTLVGPKTNIPPSVDMARANAAVQKWYGQYSLPGDPYVVKAGTNLAEYSRTNGALTKRDPVFLKDGYIILNFNIESIKNGNLSQPHLQYINAPLMNQWTMEGFSRSVQDSWGRTFALRDGDIVFFNADKSYKDDFQAEVTH